LVFLGPTWPQRARFDVAILGLRGEPSKISKIITFQPIFFKLGGLLGHGNRRTFC
jgi:hypothetical protein